MPRFEHCFLFFSCAVALAACAGTKVKPTPGDAGAGAGGMAGTLGSPGGTTGAAGVISVGGTTGSGGTGGACMPSATCMPMGGQYCGVIGNGCPGQTLDCGTTCANGWTCEMNQCVGGASVCTPLTCGSYCGEIGDNCGRKLTCATCPTGRECRGGICVDPGCVPITCAGANNVRYCGTIGDGCGGTLDCRTCPNGGTCGGTGYDPGVCNDPTCPRFSCKPMGGQYCGTIGNGCGGTQDCGACDNGMACPTTGTNAHICPGSGVTVMPTCTGATKTTISGTVYDPAGATPLYNVIVYVPNGPLPAIAEGATCEKCGAQVIAPLASALTDTSGHFSMVLEPVPSTTNVPLVMQIGKWRRQIMIPSIQTCRDNPLTDKNQTRLPKDSGEGHLPKIAVTTGGSDALECFLREIGIADSEFTTDTGAGRVNLYVGGEPGAGGGGQGAASFDAAHGGAALPAATTLWSNVNKMLGYDIVVHSCEGGQFDTVKMPYINNVKRYADSGGRLFNSHLHYYWLRMGPAPWPTTANYLKPTKDLSSPVTATIDTTFAKGMAFGAWMVATGGTTTPGMLPLYGSQHSVTTTIPPTSQRWIWIPASGSVQESTQYLTIGTPVEAAQDMQCGRVVVTDIHVKEVANGGGDDSDPSKPFPTACKVTSLTGQAKALEFMFFDLSSCIEPPTKMPTAPVPMPPGTTTGPPGPTGKPPAVPPPPPPPPPPVPG